MTTTTRYSASDHALTNCKGQLENIIELYNLRDVDEFMSGEIHEEMNQELRLKEQDIKLKDLN